MTRRALRRRETVSHDCGLRWRVRDGSGVRRRPLTRLYRPSIPRKRFVEVPSVFEPKQVNFFLKGLPNDSGLSLRKHLSIASSIRSPL